MRPSTPFHKYGRIFFGVRTEFTPLCSLRKRGNSPCPLTGKVGGNAESRGAIMRRRIKEMPHYEKATAGHGRLRICRHQCRCPECVANKSVGSVIAPGNALRGTDRYRSPPISKALPRMNESRIMSFAPTAIRHYQNRPSPASRSGNIRTGIENPGILDKASP